MSKKKKINIYRSTNQTFEDPVQVTFEYAKLHHWERDKPDWFKEAYQKGQIQVTHNNKNSYVVVHNKNEKTGKISTVYAYENDWIIRNKAGIIFTMPEILFEASFEFIEEKEVEAA